MSDKRRRMADTSRPQHRFHVAPDKFNVRAVDIRLYFLPTEKEDDTEHTTAISTEESTHDNLADN